MEQRGAVVGDFSSVVTIADVDQALLDDAQYLAKTIEDNESRNSKGITELDLSVCFEMSALCEWGRTYTVGRFNRAVKELDQLDTVGKRDGRWFVSGNAKLVANVDGD